MSHYVVIDASGRYWVNQRDGWSTDLREAHRYYDRRFAQAMAERLTDLERVPCEVRRV